MQKSSARTHHFPSAPSQRAELLASFRKQMADHARGERLKALRTERRLNQEDAAHEIGVSAKTLRTWEKGGPIKWENAKAAANFYEVDPESLVEREPAPPIDLMDALKDAEVPSVKRVEDQIAALRTELLSELAAARTDLADRLTKLEPAERNSASKRS